MPAGTFSDRLLQVRHAVAAPDGGCQGIDALGGGGAVSSTARAPATPELQVELGARFSQVIRAAARQQPLEDAPGRERDALALLAALREGYGQASFQAEVRRLQAQDIDELGFLTALAKVASEVQDPIFQRFGLPNGQRGVLLMKMAIKVIAGHSSLVAELAGDLRELLGLRREEESRPSILNMVKDVAASLAELVAKIARAPVDVRGPLAEALRLPYKASPEQIAREVPKIRQIARQLADKNLGRPRAEIVGDGKLLGPEVAADTSDAQLHVLLVQSFEHYLNKMLARVITPVESFTKAPEDFTNPWADRVVRCRQVVELWGPQPTAAEDQQMAEWPSLGVGITVADDVLEGDLAARAREELVALEASGGLQASKDPCNVGARSVWLHFETLAERQRLPPALAELCDRLAGLPHALLACAAELHGAEAVCPPRLRVHPHVMAATYRQGAEYHVHKDSYSGADNQRVLTILLYITDGWRPGDGGELRVHGTCSGDGASASAPDEGRFADIAPLSGRLVFFRSREVWHAVREPKTQRWALTLWVMAD